ncbi:hypothetical protein ACIGEP_15925 [Microbacterium sp. NPDC077663]|uniref:hypothetical protein n=1 Tax=Microbacterium sp. NPDC077663 TaxID=3364189 RepID=UPI0037C7F30A
MGLARTLLDIAIRDEQVAHRITADVDVPAVRGEIRRLARQEGVRIRTALMNDVLVVVRANAKVWTDTQEMMRHKLTPR